MATLAKRASVVVGTTNTTWGSTSNILDGTVGTNPATYATWVNAVALASASVDLGFDFSSLSTSDVLTSISVAVRHQESQTARFSGVVTEPFVSGVSVATAQLAVLSTTARTDTHIFTGITMAQLKHANFVIRIRIDRLGGTISSTFSLDNVDVTATYAAATGRPKVCTNATGPVFTQKPLKVCMSTGPAVWTEKPVYVWTGSLWKKLT